MYITASQVLEAMGWSTEKETQAQQLANLASQYIDDYVWYNLLNADHNIWFDIKKCVEKIFLPRAKINSVTLTLDGSPLEIKNAYHNAITLKQSVSTGVLAISYNAWRGDDPENIPGLVDIALNIAKGIQKDQELRENNENLKSIKIWDLQKSFGDTYNTTPDGVQLTQSEIVLRPFKAFLDKFKVWFAFVNSRYDGVPIP